MLEEAGELRQRHVGEEAEEGSSAPHRPYYANSWAAVIGINCYRHLSEPLNYAVADADSVADLLIMGLDFPPDNVFVILDPPPQRDSAPYSLFSSSATKAAIEELLLTFLPAKTGADDRVFIFFAGHGKRRQLANRAAKGYLMPTDARPGAWHEWIEMASILDANLYEAKHVFYVLDACYSGLAATRSPTAQSRYHEDLLTRRSRQILTAGKDDQVVADVGGEGHSIFTDCLLRGLGGDAMLKGSGVITGFDLMRYVTKSVGEHTNSKQTPDEGTRLGHRGGDFIFRLPKEFGLALSPQEHLTLGSRLYELGQWFSDRGRYRSARRQFEEVMRRPNVDEELAEQARLSIARTFVAEGDLGHALKRLEDLTSPADSAPPPEALIALAVTYAKRQEPALAIDTLGRFVVLYSEHRDAPWVKDFIAALEAYASGRRRALLVGNDEYLENPGWSLPGCANDVQLMTRMLIEVFGFRESDITPLTGSAATRERILNELTSLVEITKPGDSVVFFHSGHAHHAVIDEQRVGVLLPYDASQDPSTRDMAGVIAFGELDEFFRRITARRKWVILDSGGGELVAQVEHDRQYNLYVAASPGEMTYSAPTGIGYAGAFTYAMTDGLRKGDGQIITHRELHQRTIAGMENARQKQTPQFVAAPDEIVMPKIGAASAFVASWEFAHEGRVHSDSRFHSIDEFVHEGQSPYIPAERVFGRAFLDRGRFIDAERAFERVLQSGSIPDAGDQFNLARAQLGARQFAKAVEALRATLSAEPDHRRRGMLGDLERMVNRLEQDPPKFALLVGVEDSGQGERLPPAGAEDDVELVMRALVEHANFESANITVLMNDSATDESILANLEILAEHGAGASTLFYFAGNGLYVGQGTPVILCPSAKPTISPGLGLAELAERVAQSPNLVTIIDAAWYAEAGLAQETRRAGGETIPDRGESGAETVIGTVSILTQGLRAGPETSNRGRLTQELVRVLAEPRPTPLTYCEWVGTASGQLDDPKPVVYGPHADQPIFSDGALFQEAQRLAGVIDHLRFEVAIRLLEGLIRRRRQRDNDEYPEGRLNLALLWAAMGDHGRALDQLTYYAEPALLELDPMVEPERDEWLRLTRYHTGRLLYETRRDLGTAVDKLRDAAAATVDDVRVQFYLGQSLRALADEVQRESHREATEALREYLLAGAPLGFKDVREFLATSGDVRP